MPCPYNLDCDTVSRLGIMIKLKRILTLTAVAVAMGACDSVDDDRIPYAPVHLSFATVADWLQRGVAEESAGARTYVSTPGSRNNIPSGYPYKAADATGFGGLLLVTDVLGSPVAYDLSCPYEARRDVRIEIPQDELFARCPKCGSTYDVFTNHGYPMSGPAAEHGYALQRYSVTSGGALEYRVVTR